MEFKEINLKPREYQKKIFETAREGNTLVVLPTGLGKTLIALMLAVERLKKHVGSKAVFLAPTRPLVEQHFNTFKKNLPELFADLQLFTGSVNANKRKKIFQTAEIIFSTPQCVANDLAAGLYDLKDVSLLVVDEAHRCLKNYDYTKVLDYYKRQSENQRILALTASPGSNPENVREICRHLDVSEIEVRTRESDDVKQYLQNLDYEKVEVVFPAEFVEIKLLLNKIFYYYVNKLREMGLINGPSNKIILLLLQKKLAGQTNGGNFFAMRGMSLTASAIKISHATELLETQTLSGLKAYMLGLMKQADDKKSKAVQSLVRMPEFIMVIKLLNILLEKGIEHPKIEECAVIVEEEMKKNPKAKIIIFTQFRESATNIVSRLNKIKDVRASVFLGQTKKGNTGFSQKEQKEVIIKLNSGELNCLVATSIGEEGLDISEVSAVIFYEPIPSAIRKIQRTGRTARLAPGKLIILMTKDTRDIAHHYASSARERKMYRVLEEVRREIGGQQKSLKDFSGAKDKGWWAKGV